MNNKPVGNKSVEQSHRQVIRTAVNEKLLIQTLVMCWSR